LKNNPSNENNCDEEFETTRPHNTGRLYEYLINYKIHTMLDIVGESFEGLRLLNVCCGSGMETEFLAKLGAKVTGLDISEETLARATKRAKLFNFPLETVQGSAESLPFESNSYDYAFVHDGLHHLSDPQKGISEMARVAKKGIFFTEPAEALITRIATRLGLAVNYEDAGNYVYRFEIRKLRELLKNLGFNKMLFKRYGMWYSHCPPRWFKLFNWSIPFVLFKFFFYLSNTLFGKFGNKIAVVAWKNDTCVIL